MNVDVAADVSAVVDAGDRPADVVAGDVPAVVDASEGEGHGESLTIVQCSSKNYIIS